MVKKEVLDILRQFKEFLERKKIHIERMILFGSWAGGSPEEGSDIDVVVISKNFADKDYWQRMNVLSDAIYEVFAPIEAIAMTPQEWERKDSVICEFAQNGEVI